MKSFAQTWGALAAVAIIAAAGVAGLAASADAAELLAFVSARCPYCVAWEREAGRIYARTWEAAQAPLRRIDADASNPADLDWMTNVSATPTFVLVENGREVGRISGYASKDQFWRELDKLLARLHAAPTL